MAASLIAMGIVARSRGWVASAICGVFMVGCGGVTEPRGGEGVLTNDPGGDASDRFALAKSGQRVLALGYVSEGVEQFRTLHDGQLDFDCEFVKGEPGADLHCVPKQQTSLIFLDASCSQPATWIMDRAQGVGEWVSVGLAYRQGSEVMLPHRDVFELGEEVYPESDLSEGSQVYELQGTSCTRAWPPAKSLPAVNRLIAHSDTELATAKLLDVDAGGGLHLSRLIGGDGLEFTAAVTTADGVACAVQPSGEFATMTGNGSAAAPATQRVRLGVAAVHVELISSLPSGGRAGVPVAQYPAETDFLDDAGDLCRPTPAVDGTLRCAAVVLGAYQSDRWSDAACTQRLYYSDYPGTDFTMLHAPVRASDGSLTAVATVKGYDGPTYAIDSDGCVPRESGATLVQLDQRIDISAMPEVFETTL